MGAIERHKPFRLSDEGYRQLCKLVDERDGGCVICGRPDVDHHHVVFRSAGGEDRLENLISLCRQCHTDCGHGEEEKEWRREFLQWLQRTEVVEFAESHQEELQRIYKMERK